MKNPHLGIAALLIGLVAVLTLLFVKATVLHEGNQASFESLQRELRETDTALNLAVLSSRFGLLPDYDALTRGSRSLREGAAALDPLPAFLDASAQDQLRPLAARYQAHLEQKIALVERFKSENAVLRNSLAYFPGAAAGLAQRTPGRHDPMAQRLNILLQSLLLYIQSPDEESAGRIADHIRLMESERRLYPVALAADSLNNLLLHARTLLRTKPAVDSLTRDILLLPTQEAAETLNRAYTAQRERIQFQANIYRTLLYLAALGLSAYVLSVILRLRLSSRALARSNQALEERIAEQQQAEQSLRLQAKVFAGISEGVLITDADSRVLSVNEAFTEITGFPAEDILGQTPSILRSGRHDRTFYQNMWAQLQANGQWRGEIWNRRRSGEPYPQWISIAALRDAAGEVTNYVAIFADITERKQTEEHIRHLAHHDALTGLPNRMLLQDRLSQALGRAKRDQGEGVAVMFVDLDRFKNINDTLGHDRGDDVLKLAARRMSSLVRGIDTVSRQGGDEFVIILPQLGHPADAAGVARKVIAALAEPFTLEGHELTITCSIGIAVSPEDGESPQELMRNADTAMYRAKAEGRNTFRYYRADMNAESLESLVLESRLRHALERGELSLHYQPQLDLANHRISGVEALLRWTLPDLGMIPPDRFIPLAEETGLIEPIGAWVLHSACCQAAAWQQAGQAPLVMAVNLSARQFSGESLVDLILEALKDSGLPAACLELELTESMLMRNPERSAATLRELKSMGIKMAIDDFGTGYSSLTYLRQFPLDRLKIDQSFVRGIGVADEDATIVRATIGLAHTLSLEVVAEGVETLAQYSFLEAMGCDNIQGYYIARPAPAEEIEAMLGQQPLQLTAAPCTTAP